MTSIDTIYLDLDGVLVDLVRGFLEKIGIFDPYWYAHPDRLGEPDMWRLLQSQNSPTQMSIQEWWSIVDHHDFWANLPFMVDGQEILTLVEERVGRENIVICSSPSNDNSSITGKRAWIKRHMPKHYHTHYIFTNVKGKLGAPGVLLVDDFDKNVKAFSQKGLAFLVPRLWNSRHPYANSAKESLIQRLF